ncbi:TetR/AcrR family transcriptional regulator [Microbacterium marinilacus]|uniref:TetR/AcrR family transcriptional regulator n=1 Tax=Microbacterium marinilacus TaxID=415209 RepID=A0ABP7BW04_9MICO|nr:TetR/AcrR family transcriptional regulator [Microbacterium marinilacus]MBY0689041.1 TetR/AcrR family transcriptional regulator [Microbacterium marinilacus]
MGDGYHHGDLRRALLDEAVRAISDSGVGALSLREVARRAGVSHAAPAHHFGDRRGLMTALAADGLRLLAEELGASVERGFDETAVAYVRFARDRPGHYAVMHRPELVDAAAPELVEARAAASARLAAGVRSIPAARRRHVTEEQAAQAAWALVHGLASLAAEGAVPADDVEELTRSSARQLFG